MMARRSLALCSALTRSFSYLTTALLGAGALLSGCSDEGVAASGGGGAGLGATSGETTTGATGGVGGATGSGASAGSGAGSPGGYLPPYDPSFAINVVIPDGVLDDPRSAAVASRLKEITTQKKVMVGNQLDSPSVYESPSSAPTYEVTFDQWTVHFRVPTNAQPGGGSDTPLELLDPMSQEYGPFTELRLWQASIDHASQRISASGGGLFHYNNDGAVLNPDGTKSYSNPFLGYGTGSGLTYLAGMIDDEDVAGGAIRHAIRIAYSACNSTSTFRAPATKTDQPNGCDGQMVGTDDEKMEMGMRLQLDPTVDCSARTVPGKANDSLETGFVRMVCRALQTYGMIMLDGSGPGGLFIYMEHDNSANWAPLVGDELWDSYSYIVRDKDTPDDGLTRTASDGIPWERFRVLATSVF